MDAQDTQHTPKSEDADEASHEASSPHEIDFVTLGMFIIGMLQFISLSFLFFVCSRASYFLETPSCSSQPTYELFRFCFLIGLDLSLTHRCQLGGWWQSNTKGTKKIQSNSIVDRLEATYLTCLIHAYLIFCIFDHSYPNTIVWTLTASTYHHMLLKWARQLLVYQCNSVNNRF